MHDLRMGFDRNRERAARLQSNLADARSGRVVFISHCLLNQNTRYLGGAVCPGVVGDAIRRHVDSGTGIVQMPCPEQSVWGGVTKRLLLWLVDHPRVARAGEVLLAFARPYMALRYRRIARRVVREIADYIESGFTVESIVGVAGSPSCGVTTRTDLPAALRALSARGDRRPTRDWMTQEVVCAATTDGSGIFIDALATEMSRRGLDVSISEYDLGDLADA